MRRAWLLLVALLVAAWPAAAWACPSCATREGPGLGVFMLIGAMIAVPYAVTAVVLRVIRRLDLDREPRS